MKQISTLALALVLFGLPKGAWAKSLSKAQRDFQNSIHILPDAPSSEYQKAQQGNAILLFLDTPTSEAVALGNRNLQWLKYMNQFRDEAHQLKLTTQAGGLHGVPIDQPNKYNPSTVKAQSEKNKAEMPKEMADVLYSNQSFPQNPPVDDATYAIWAKKVDANYQTAVRWNLMQPYLLQLEARQRNDVRGYYFLKRMENLEGQLRSLETLAPEKQVEIRTWLTQICQNSEGLSAGCDKNVANAIQGKKAYELYLKYNPAAEELWNSYFALYNPRPEMQWDNGHDQQAILPFQNPNNSKVMDFLKINIQDEWKWSGWQLILDFQSRADVHVEFESGVTPHVNGVGGNTITMDDNAPLSEWDVQWTIRHEFGHVLGFVDCYVEFYNPKEKYIMNYQLDLDNLMCSRKGRFLQTHYDTMKKAYFNK